MATLVLNTMWMVWVAFGATKERRATKVILAHKDLKAFLASVALLAQKVTKAIPAHKDLLAQPGQTVKMAPKALLARTPQLPAQQPA